jgi:L-alanine-DL-glutamate epimerase-like enolase superfamily enzyme
MIEAIRAAGATCLRVDANEGWRDRETALRDIEWLASRGVVLVEQPMPATQMADMAWLKARSPLPLYADEAFGVPADVLDLKEGYHGINIKLMKCGGLLAAREAISLARAVGMDVMLGCMVESSLGIAAAAQLSPLADCLDLDGNLLLAEDPFEGHAVVDGQIQLNQRPGCGAVPKALLPKS